MTRWLIMICAVAVVPDASSAVPAEPASGGQLKPPADFFAIADRRERSIALFAEMGKVLTHPRCLNCHPRTDRPRQGDASLPHSPAVTRGADGHGAAGLECSSCHGPRNVTLTGQSLASMPGSPDWRLAPRPMAWEGRSLAEICRQLKDPARNGSRTLAQIQTHTANDPLVGWGWQPGAGRRPAPGSQQRLGELTAAWIASGAQCPSDPVGHEAAGRSPGAVGKASR